MSDDAPNIVLAVVMILLAAAAISAAGGLAGQMWPPHSQQITVRLEQVQ